MNRIRFCHLIVLPILLLLSGCGEADFYNCMGYRDWFRFPLKYPYQMEMIDTFDIGIFGKYIGGDIRDPNKSVEGLLIVSALIQRYDCVIFRLPPEGAPGAADSDRPPGSRYAIFRYDSGQLQFFKDEESLKRDLKSDAPLKFQSLEEAFRTCSFKRPESRPKTKKP